MVDSMEPLTHFVKNMVITYMSLVTQYASLAIMFAMYVSHNVAPPPMYHLVAYRPGQSYIITIHHDLL